MERQKRLLIGVILFLVIFHIVGIIGLRMELTTGLFRRLTPLNLLLSLGMLALFHTNWTRFFRIFCVVIFLSGWGVEVLGVQTGIIFGEYAYGDSLGPGILGVPVMMGVNWLLMVYMLGHVSMLTGGNRLVRTTIGAGLMVLMDLLIEPFAIQFDLWDWATEHVPFQNYLAWFVISWIMMRFFHWHPIDKPNPLAFPLALIQFLFLRVL